MRQAALAAARRKHYARPQGCRQHASAQQAATTDSGTRPCPAHTQPDGHTCEAHARSHTQSHMLSNSRVAWSGSTHAATLIGPQPAACSTAVNAHSACTGALRFNGDGTHARDRCSAHTSPSKRGTHTEILSGQEPCSANPHGAGCAEAPAEQGRRRGCKPGTRARHDACSCLAGTAMSNTRDMHAPPAPPPNAKSTQRA